MQPKAETSSVLVAVRIRPFTKAEDPVLDANVVQTAADRRTVTLQEPTPQVTTTMSLQGTASATCARHSFSFDRVFSNDGPENSQEAVYHYLGPILCSQVLDGFNSCLFAYGQTGSGKTYSMVGRLSAATSSPIPTTPDVSNQSFTAVSAVSSCSAVDRQHHGMIPRLCFDLFDRMRTERERDANVTHRVECSFVEIYCEKVRDLLSASSAASAAPATTAAASSSSAAQCSSSFASSVSSLSAPSSGPLRVRQHPTRGPYVEGAVLVPVSDAGAVVRLLLAGTKERATAETRMNEQSSRSHAILQLHFTRVEVVRDSNGSVVTKTRSSKVNLVDLAGSERITQSGATGERLEEAKNINLSLHSLGRVIQVLAERSSSSSSTSTVVAEGSGAGATSYAASVPSQPRASSGSAATIPYRDSVLTWLLSDSLGGNSKTIMLATVAPTAHCYSQSLNTLRFAGVTKRVVNVATVNEDSHFLKLVSELREQILRLHAQLEAKDRESGLQSARAAAAEWEFTSIQQKAMLDEQLVRNAQLEEQVSACERELSAQRRRNELLSKECDELLLSKRALEQVAQPPKQPRSPSPRMTPMAAERVAALEVKVSDLQQCVDEHKLQLQVCNARRCEAEAGRLEAQARMDRTVAELRMTEQVKQQLARDVGQLQVEVETLRTRVPFLERQLQRVQQDIHSRSKDEEEAILALQQQVESVVGQTCADAARIQNLEADALRVQGELSHLRADIVELEQLLLEETESSQRAVLIGYCESQLWQCCRSFLRGKSRHEVAVARSSSSCAAPPALAALTAEGMRDELERFETVERATLVSEVQSQWSDLLLKFLPTALSLERSNTALITEELWRVKLLQTTRDLKQAREECGILQGSLQRQHLAKEQVSVQNERLTDENATLFQRLSQMQTAEDRLQDELTAVREALRVAEEALDAERQRRLFDQAAESDLVNLRGTLTELEEENRFVHEANSDMNSRYDLIIQRLRHENRLLRAEVEREVAEHDRRFLVAAQKRRAEKEAEQEQKERLEQEIADLQEKLSHVEHTEVLLRDELERVSAERRMFVTSGMSMTVDRNPLGSVGVNADHGSKRQ